MDNGFFKGEIIFITLNKNNGIKISSLNDEIQSKNSRFLMNNNVPFNSSMAPENHIILISCDEFSTDECLKVTKKNQNPC